MAEGKEDKRELTEGTANFDGQMLIEGSEQETLISPQELDQVLWHKMTILEAHCSVIGPIIEDIKSIKGKNSISTDKDKNIFSCSCDDSRAFNRNPIVEPFKNDLISEKKCYPAININNVASNSGNNLSSLSNIMDERAFNQILQENSSDICCYKSQANEQNINNNTTLTERNNAEKLEKRLDLNTEKTNYQNLLGTDQVFIANYSLNNEADLVLSRPELCDKILENKELLKDVFNTECLSHICGNKCSSRQSPKKSESNLTNINSVQCNDTLIASNETDIDYIKIKRVFERMLFNLKLEETNTQNNSTAIEEIPLQPMHTRECNRGSRSRILEEINYFETDVEKALNLFRRMSDANKHFPNIRTASLQLSLLDHLIENVEAVSNYAADLVQHQAPETNIVFSDT